MIFALGGYPFRLGVDEGTIRNDKNAENSAKAPNGHSEINGLVDNNAENSAPSEGSAVSADARK